MRKRLRSPAVLLVAFAMVLVAAGIGYAHWTSVSRIEANINTGNMDIGWNAFGSNDDGDPSNDPTGTDDPGILGEWTSENGTSLDPSWWAFPWPRYNKNVAGCYVDGGGDTLNVNIDSAYPSYHCSIFAEVYNHGSVPGMAAVTYLNAYEGYNQCDIYTDPELTDGPLPRAWDDEGGFEFIDINGNGTYEEDPDFWLDYRPDGVFNGVTGDPLWEDCFFVVTSEMDMTPNPDHYGEYLFGDDFTLHIEQGILCEEETQIDPGQGIPVEGWIHIEQGAEQGAQYRVVLEQQWVNWNEWNIGMCG